MNFSTHKKKLIESIEIALSKDKSDMVNAFRLILRSANSLFKSNIFDFWLEQIEQIELTGIPMTRYGLEEAKNIVKSLKNDMPTNKNLEFSLLDICEFLFTYNKEDDLCDRQSQFHYYVDVSSGIVFKQSKSRILRPQIDTVKETSDIRIAKISELNPKQYELFK